MLIQLQHRPRNHSQHVHQLCHAPCLQEHALQPFLLLIRDQCCNVHRFIRQISIRKVRRGLHDGYIREDDFGNVHLLDVPGVGGAARIGRELQHEGVEERFEDDLKGLKNVFDLLDADFCQALFALPVTGVRPWVRKREIERKETALDLRYQIIFLFAPLAEEDDDADELL